MIPSFTRKPKTIGAMSIRSARALVMMKASVAPRLLFFDYRRQHNLRIKVARIFNTYGPRHASE